MLRIDSYFSLSTDLAGEMSEWPEFVRGVGYSVDLESPDTQEQVSVRLIEASQDDMHIEIHSNITGELFDRVVGRAIFAVSAHSDNLMISRRFK